MASPMKSLAKKPKAKSGKKSKSKKKLRSLHIEPADNGGFVARHSYDASPEDIQGGGSPQDETHALGGPDELLQHVQDHFGGQMPGGSPGAGAGGGAGM